MAFMCSVDFTSHRRIGFASGYRGRIITEINPPRLKRDTPDAN
jgi:hypothetical protein